MIQSLAYPLPEWYAGKVIPKQYQARLTAGIKEVSAYRARMASVHLTLFRTRVRPLLHSFLPDLGWGHYAKNGVDVYEIPGEHGGVAEPEVAEVLAIELREAVLRSESSLEQCERLASDC